MVLTTTEERTMSDASTFLAQNGLCAKTLNEEDVDGLAQHHCGGLFVLLDYLPDSRVVKMHDSWADEDEIVVHVYDPDDAYDGEDIVYAYETGREALAKMLGLVDEGVV